MVPIITIVIVLILALNYLNIIPKKTYTAKDFNIETLKSQKDYDNDGIDDYTDIMLGAREDALNMPTYKSAYYAGGYPPENEGVCTDVIWRAVYNLKVFFDNNANVLTNDIYKIEEWQPGDIVIFEESHIGIISDKRNKNGVPYLIHNTGQPVREEDVMERYKQIITGHYRWNGLK